MEYRETQMGWWLVILIGGIMGFMAVSYVLELGDNPLSTEAFIALELLMCAVIILFYKMTVSIANGVILVSYGVGLIRIKTEPSRIVNVKSMKVPWWYGIGIRITPKGMLYSINGLNAVMINYMVDGSEKSIMIGTSEPERLRQSIDSLLNK